MNAVMDQVDPRLADIELPESVQDALQEYHRKHDEAQRQKRDGILKVLLDERKTFVDGRQSSGIEYIWERCEEAHLGMDDANRHEFHANRWMKPMSPDGPFDTRGNKINTDKCTLFIPLTRRYTNAGVAKVQEIVSSPDERPFDAKPTPVPELLKQLKDTTQVEIDGMPAERDPTPKEVNPGTGGTPENPLPLMPAPDVDTSKEPGKKLTKGELAAEEMRMASEAVEPAARRMHDSMVECRFAKEDRRVIQDAGRLGTGIMKGPIPEMSRGVVATRKKVKNPETGVEEEVLAIEVREEIKPVFERVPLWDFYPDPGCGEDIQNGSATWQKADLSRGALQKLAKLRGYSKRAIEKILDEGPIRPYETKDHQPLATTDKKSLPYQAWYRYGTMSRKQYQLLEQDLNDPVPLEANLEDIYIQATIVNDQIIQLVQQPNEKSGQFPYHVFKWLEREGHWTGIGIPEQGMPAQRIINAAVRRLVDNVGFSAGMQLLIDQDLVEPAPDETGKQSWKIQAVKVWRKKQGTMIDDMRKAMHTVTFPNAQAQLSWLIEFGIRLFEETLNIPLVTQGWSGKTTPETLGGQELQDSNANQMLRDVVQNHDQGIIVSAVLQRYEWHLLDPNVPDEEKNELKIFARGSGVQLDRYLQRQVYERHLPMLVQGSRAFGVDPKRLFEEVWRGYRLDPSRIQYTKDELKQLESQPPPEDPQVTATKMRLEAEMQKAQLMHDLSMKELQLKFQIAQMENQTAMAKLTSEERAAFETNKRSLAETTMELSAQTNLATTKTNPAPEVAHAAMEPAGRAENGRAFQQ